MRSGHTYTYFNKSKQALLHTANPGQTQLLVIFNLILFIWAQQLCGNALFHHTSLYHSIFVYTTPCLTLYYRSNCIQRKSLLYASTSYQAQPDNLHTYPSSAALHYVFRWAQQHHDSLLFHTTCMTFFSDCTKVPCTPHCCGPCCPTPFCPFMLHDVLHYKHLSNKYCSTTRC